MKVEEAKDQVIELADRDLDEADIRSPIDSRSPDAKDPGKFGIQGRTCRAIHRFDGWHVPISLSWFLGEIDQPEIHSFPFYWYAFAIPQYGGFDRRRYFICDYLQVRDWVLDFEAPLGNDYQDQSTWRADFQPYQAADVNSLAYFRWGDEAIQEQTKLSRIVELDNIVDIVGYQTRRRPIEYKPESEAHLRLKEHIAAHAEILGLSSEFSADIEHFYMTGDHVDIEFSAPDGRVAIVEVELEGEKELVIGAHQAVKYRSLSRAQRRYSLDSDRVQAFLVAFNTEYPELISFADQYNIDLRTVSSEDVLQKVPT